MTLRIERFGTEHRTRLRLSGELRFEQLKDLRTEMDRSSTRVTLDLDELDLVDVAAVRFLNACEAQNAEIVNCAPFIREWMLQERASERNSERS